MIGRSGSSAFSWVAASQSLRIGRWRAAGAAAVDCIVLPPGGRRFTQVCDGGTKRRKPRFELGSVSPRFGADRAVMRRGDEEGSIGLGPHHGGPPLGGL